MSSYTQTNDDDDNDGDDDDDDDEHQLFRARSNQRSITSGIQRSILRDPIGASFESGLRVGSHNVFKALHIIPSVSIPIPRVTHRARKVHFLIPNGDV